MESLYAKLYDKYDKLKVSQLLFPLIIFNDNLRFYFFPPSFIDLSYNFISLVVSRTEGKSEMFFFFLVKVEKDSAARCIRFYLSLIKVEI